MLDFTAVLAQAVDACQSLADRFEPGADYSTIIEIVAHQFDVSEIELADAWAYVEDMEALNS